VNIPRQYAQTNVQLFNQLRSDGYSEKEREYIRDTYVFAMPLFAGLYLPSGRPFIDHLVGTASILASLRVPVEIVAAALVHAAYLHGDFGSPHAGISAYKQSQLRRMVGDTVEDYVARYDRLLLTPEMILSLDRTLDQATLPDRYVALMRLANELEHGLDLGELYYVHGEKRQRAHRSYMERRSPLLIKLAYKLGFPSLAGEIKKLSNAVAAVELPLEPTVRFDHNEAFLLAPRSYRERFLVLCYRKLSEARRELSTILRRAGRLTKNIFRVARHIIAASARGA
jgi:(p)ppGpp synthase/HD superfamily hydrolase